MRLSDRDHLDLFRRLPHLKEGEDLQRTGMGESRRGAEAMRPAHLHHAPQPRGVALARDDEELAAARQEARQARERFVDVVLRDARLVEPDLGRPPLALLERRGPPLERREFAAGRHLLVGPRVRHERVDLAEQRLCRPRREQRPRPARARRARGGGGRRGGRRRRRHLRCVGGSQILGIPANRRGWRGTGSWRAPGRRPASARRTGWRRRPRAAARCLRAFRAHRGGERARRGGGRSAGWRTRRR